MASCWSRRIAKGSPRAPTWRSGCMHEQQQFLQVVDRDEAERRFRSALDLAPLGLEPVALDAALGRVLEADIFPRVDVTSVDRSIVDDLVVYAVALLGHS